MGIHPILRVNFSGISCVSCVASHLSSLLSYSIACSYRFNKEFDVRTGYKTKSVLCWPIKNPEGNTFAVIQALNKKPGGSFAHRHQVLCCDQCQSSMA